MITFVLYLGVQWWASWYPGAEPGGGGYVAQRMFSAKDEKNSLGATLWFNIANYAMRSWPWIVTGLVAVAVYSTHGGLHPSAEFAAEPEKGYVMVLRDFLPPALRGLMIAAFLAAFMSTVGTQLNWGTSYFINDFYRRFVVRKGTEKHYVTVSKLFIVLLVILSGYTAAHITSIQSAWQLLLGMGAGTGGVLMLRWYWWRVNAWSEISAMVAAFVTSISLAQMSFTGNTTVVFAKTALITTAVTTIVWLVVTMITPPETDERLLKFYRRVHPNVHGWKRIAAARAGDQAGARFRREYFRLDHGLHARLLLHVRNRRTRASGVDDGNRAADHFGGRRVLHLLELVAPRMGNAVGRFRQRGLKVAPASYRGFCT